MTTDAYIIAASLLSVLIFGGSAKNVKSVANNKGGSMKSSNRDQLNKEQEKLNRLIEEAMEKGTPPGESEAILEQSRKVDELMNQHQQEV
jgi:hypothetical protein